MLKSNKFWIIALGGALAISVAAVLLLQRAPTSVAYIYQNSELIRKLDLSTVTEPYSFTIQGNGSDVNVITVENGRICISEANCPDGSCVRQGWVKGGLVPIVCLPHNIVIKLEGNEKPEVDAIVG